ncbi:MAG TPA: hypothetical protein VGM03_10825 [Phycisphaerae bacterium]|jgi:hypothetical protein
MMAAATGSTVELSLKVRLSKQAEAKLAERAAASGQRVGEYASHILEHAAASRSIDEILAPFRRQVAESGMSDEELEQLFEQLRDQVWRERQGSAQ